MRRFLDARAERAAGRATAKRPRGLARPASAANATNESGGEAEPKGGSKGCGGWAAVRSLRSARGAAHSVAPRLWITEVEIIGATRSALLVCSLVQVNLYDIARVWACSSSNRTGGYKETKVAKNGHSGEQIRS